MGEPKSVVGVGRKMHRVLGRRRAWGLAFQGLQAIATLALMAVVLWAAFSARTSEALLRGARDASSGSSREFAPITQDERAFEEEAQAVQAVLADAGAKLLEAQSGLKHWQYRLESLEMDIAALTEERDRLRIQRADGLAELSEIRTQVAELESQLAEALAERDRYQGVPFGRATEQLLLALSAALDEPSRYLSDARFLQRLPEFGARQKELDRQLTWTAGSATRSEIERAWSERYAEDADWARWRTGSTNVPREQASLRQALITAAADRPLRGEEIVLGILQRESFGYLLDRDWTIFDATVRSLAEEHRMLLVAPLRITLRNNFTDEDLARAIRQTQRAMDDMQRFATLLREALVASLPEAK